MKKRVLALLSLVLCVSLLPTALAAGTAYEEAVKGLLEEENLPTVNPAETQPSAATEFTDVPAGSWFEQGVATCAERGVMVGTGADKFSPDWELSAVECLTLAVRLYDLQHGGDGKMEKAPENWGRITLTLANGTVFDAYSEDSPFSWWEYRTARKGLYVTVPGETHEEQATWAKAHKGAATLTIDGVDYPGSVDCWMPVESYVLMFSPEYPEEAEDAFAATRAFASIQSIIRDAIYANIPGPERWYRDVVYTAHQLGLRDRDTYPGFSALLDRTLYNGSGADRMDFSLALAEATGTLEPLFPVESLPDLERTGNEAIFGLYEAGVLTGMDAYGRFGAENWLTRAQAAVMVARVLDESQRVTTPPQEGGAYAQAVAELRNKMVYSNEQTFETDLCTVFVYDLGGFMNAPTGAIQIIYKAGSPLGEGYVLDPPHVRSGWSITPADTMELSADQKTFTYSYFYDTTAWDSSLQGDDTRVEPGTFTFTVDLASGEVYREYRPLDYAGAMAHVTRRQVHSANEHSRDREVVRTIETDICTVVLTNGGFVGYDDYILSLVYKPGSALGDGAIKQLILPSTVYDKVHAWYKPTDRPPDSLEVSGDGTTLTYVYHFDQALSTGSGVYHEAGTYTYTVDLATGELSVAHTEN